MLCRPVGERQGSFSCKIHCFVNRDGSGIARNAGAVGSEHLHGSSYARGQSYSNKEVDPLLLGVDHFAPSHDPDNAHQQQQDDEQQVSPDQRRD